MTKHISQKDVVIFLEKYHGGIIKLCIHIQEGKHSDAFSYVHGTEEYIVRFNVNDEGFLKDAYAYKHFSHPKIFIPKIIEIGTYNENLFFCISEKVRGETAKEQYIKGDFSSLLAQFQTIEAIGATPINTYEQSFGVWNKVGKAQYNFDTYFKEICTGSMGDWSVFKDLSYFDIHFVNYLLSQIKKYVIYSAGERVLVHGDFGGSNLIMNGEKVSGIIDWGHSFYGDHFWDVGRIVLFCPNKKATTNAALDFYKNAPHYKERIAWGVYCVMLKNYGVALQSGQEASCLSSEGRIREIETVLDL